jgi:hypothetical protein
LSDIFHEVEEDVRRERYEKLWKQYGDYIIAGVAVIVIGVAGYKFYQRYEYDQRLSASSAFNAAQTEAGARNTAGAASAFGRLAKTAPSGYAAISKLAEADALYASGNDADAIAIYKSIAAQGGSALADVARIRAAWATVESVPKSQIETLLAPLTDQTNPWRFAAREILAYADYRAGALGQAETEFSLLAADSNAPQSLRGRSRAMASFLKAGGDKEYGTVPPLQPQAPAQPARANGKP